MGIGQLDVVVGGQFGSEAKGHVTAQLAKRRIAEGFRVTAVRVAGPNAGHTAVGVLDGKAWSLRQVPVAAVVDLSIQLVIGAGSEVDEQVLASECRMLDDAGYRVTERLVVDGQATVLEEHHKLQEQRGHYNERFGSTGKGIGAARAARIERYAATWAHDGETSHDTAKLLRERLWNRECVIVEGTQGYGLGLHAGYYPFCTSSDCRAIDFLAMAGLSPWQHMLDLDVWVVCRTFPIRVAGNSGPLHGELTWDDMKILTDGYVSEPELTTVTRKPRRIGTWDPELVRNALWANGAPSERTHLVITFLDYIDPHCAGTTKLNMTDRATAWLREVERDMRQPISAVTTGPDTICWRDRW